MNIQPVSGRQICLGNTKLLIDGACYYVSVEELAKEKRRIYIRFCVISGGNGTGLVGLILHGYMVANLSQGQVIKAADSTKRPIFRGTELVNVPKEKPLPCSA